jgi:TatD DNase family protein
MDMALGHGEPVPVDQALAEAAAVGVTTIVQIGCDLPGARWAAEVAASYDEIWAGVALHPNEAPRLAARGALDDAYDEIDRLAALPQVRVVGETGLDYFRTGPDGRDIQHDSFRRHIDMAKRHAKALAIHDRDAHDDVLRILEEEGPPERVVFHCYSGDAGMARVCAERGYYLSYAGTVTFANAPNLREALLVTPRDRVLVETDAPFLAPMPYRGRPNASYLIPVTLRAMAGVLDADLDELCADVMANTRRAFALP